MLINISDLCTKKKISRFLSTFSSRRNSERCSKKKFYIIERGKINTCIWNYETDLGIVSLLK